MLARLRDYEITRLRGCESTGPRANRTCTKTDTHSTQHPAENKEVQMIRLRRFLRAHYGSAILAPLFKMLEALFQLLVPLIMARVIDVGIAQKDTSYILWHAALLLGMAALGYLMAVIAQYVCAKLGAQFGMSLRNALFKHVLSLSQEEIDRVGRASLTTRITSDSQTVQDGLTMFFRLVLRSPFVTLGALVAAFFVDGLEGLILTAAVAISFVIVMMFMQITTRRYRLIQQGLDTLLHKAIENLEGARPLRAFLQESEQKQSFKHSASKLREQQIRTGNISALVNPVTYAMLYLGLIVVFWQGGLKVNVGALSQGELVALVSYITQILVELIKLAALIITLSRASASAKRINEIFALPASRYYEDKTDATSAGVTSAAVTGADKARTTSTSSQAVSLSFNQVSFTYPDGTRALQDISFELKPGETLGIIGGTGSGKSTIAALIMRLYDPTSGTITLGDKALSSYTQAELCTLVSLAEQKPRLFSGTIRDNLAWALESKSIDVNSTQTASAADNAMLWALDLAQANNFLDEKAGLDRSVAQFGQNFSGGQKQRLSLARTLLKQTPLVVLDDVSSALDFATDARLRHALATELGNTTKVIISQRVSSIAFASRILVLDAGHIVGIGTHDELLTSCKIYQEIAASQTGSALSQEVA